MDCALLGGALGFEAWPKRGDSFPLSCGACPICLKDGSCGIDGGAGCCLTGRVDGDGDAMKEGGDGGGCFSSTFSYEFRSRESSSLCTSEACFAGEKARGIAWLGSGVGLIVGG